MLLTISRLDDLVHTTKRHHVTVRTLTIGGVGGGVCNVVLTDPLVSPIHARVTLSEQQILVEDLGSTGGTRVNGVRITEPTRAREGDLILVGETVLRFSTPTRRPTPLSPGVEEAFLAALRAQPSDDATRMVYADWLEQHDRAPKADLVRLELARETTPETERPELDTRRRVLLPIADQAWRATVSRTDIEKCSAVAAAQTAGLEFELLCPKRWSALTPTQDPNVRHCTTCEKSVHYCTSLAEVKARGLAGACVAFDAALVHDAAITAYEHQPATWKLMGQIKLMRRS